jgi:hypothetical protein
MLWISSVAQADVIAYSFVDTGGTQNSEIREANLDGTGVHTIVSGPVSGRFGGIAFDESKGYLYSGDGSFLFRTNLDGSNRTNLVSLSAGGNQFVGDVELDLTHGKIYYTATHTTITQIFSANLDGTGVQTVVNPTSGNIEGIALDPLRGKLYWADEGNAIHVANLDGSGQSIFKTLPSGAFPFDVESDPANGKLYWDQYSPGNNANRLIRSANLDGSGSIQDLVSASPNRFQNGFDFDTINQKLYYALQPESGGGTNLGLYQANADGTGQQIVLSESAAGVGAFNYMEVLHTIPEPGTMTLMVLSAIPLLGYRWLRSPSVKGSS